MATFLTREQIISRQRAKTVTVAVPEWGGDVQIRPLNAGEVQGMAGFFSGGDRDLASNLEAAFHLVAAGAITADGGPLFEGADDLRGLEIGAIVKIASAIADASGMAGGNNAGN